MRRPSRSRPRRQAAARLAPAALASALAAGCGLADDRCLDSTRGYGLAGALADTAGRAVGTARLTLREQRGNGGPIRDEQSIEYVVTGPPGAPVPPQNVRVRVHVGAPAGPGAPVLVTLVATRPPAPDGAVLANEYVSAAPGQLRLNGGPDFAELEAALRRGPVYLDVQVVDAPGRRLGGRLERSPGGPPDGWTRSSASCS